jgi:hypothetical protein
MHLNRAVFEMPTSLHYFPRLVIVVEKVFLRQAVYSILPQCILICNPNVRSEVLIKWGISTVLRRGMTTKRRR